MVATPTKPRQLAIEIPFSHAGMPITPAPDTAVGVAMIESEGKRYTVQNGYLVPFYPPDTREQSQRREQLVCDRAKRFFYTAEPGLDVRLTGRDLARAKDDYEHCPVAELQKVKARHLVGAIVNRMERLSRAMLQGTTDGVGLEIEAEGEHHALSPQQIAECKKEFVDHYTYLTIGEGTKPMQWVRLRNNTPDHDGVLSDLVREMGKPIAMPEQMVSGGILQKMGYTMAGIDAVRDTLLPMVKSPVVGLALDKAYERINTRRYGHDYEIARSGSQHYQQMLHELADLNRARCSLKSEDYDNFFPVRERIAYLNDQFSELHKEMRGIAHLHGFSGVMRAQHLLTEGVELMNEMAMMRLPKTHDSLDVMADKTHPERDTSSAGILKEDVQAWLAERSRGR